jgi:hypothetical protein
VCRGRTAEGVAIYKDAAHLRASFVREHAAFIDQTLDTDDTGSDITTSALP